MLVQSRHALATLLLAILAISTGAYAQENSGYPVPAAEVTAGYTFMRDFSDQPGGDHVDFPAGWYLAGAFNVNHWFGVVAEATRSYKNNLEFSASYPGYGHGAPPIHWSSSHDFRVQTYMAGGRFFRQYGRFVPFAQVLAGAAHMKVRSAVTSPSPYRSSWSDTQFALQPGGGMTVYLTRHVGVRFSADYRTIIDFVDGEENDYTNEFRLLSGFTLQWGAR